MHIYITPMYSILNYFTIVYEMNNIFLFHRSAKRAFTLRVVRVISWLSEAHRGDVQKAEETEGV